jgi:hypothetical protein
LDQDAQHARGGAGTLGWPAPVINVELTWQQAGAAACALAATSGALRLVRRQKAAPGKVAAAAAFTRESSLLFGLFALWQLAGSLAIAGPSGALARSRWIWHFERVIGLPSETSVQRVFLPHPLLIQFFNLYYDILHFPVLIGCLIWLFGWHRDRYRQVRTTLVVFTAACLLVQLVPVAPPRMLTSTGLVDTAVLYHESVYSNVAGFDPDQLSAMPSVHVGWALLVAIAVITTARTRWRWLALAYPAMTTLVVVVTANHFWLDGIVAALLLAMVLGLQSAARRLIGRRRRLLVVADEHAQALGEHGREHRQLASADHGAAQRASVDDDAQVGSAQVGAAEPGLGEVRARKLRAGEAAAGQRRAGEVYVAQHAVLEGHVGQAGRAEVDRVELAAGEDHPAQLGAEHLDAC